MNNEETGGECRAKVDFQSRFSASRLFLMGLVCGAAGTIGCWVAAAGVGAEAGYVASQENRSAEETINDQRITTMVKSKLLAEPVVSGLDINVDTFKGQVTLRGFVDSREEANRAVALAQAVPGVKDVRSTLVLK